VRQQTISFSHAIATTGREGRKIGATLPRPKSGEAEKSMRQEAE
jgi:hypothetical protein